MLKHMEIRALQSSMSHDLTKVILCYNSLLEYISHVNATIGAYYQEREYAHAHIVKLQAEAAARQAEMEALRTVEIDLQAAAGKQEGEIDSLRDGVFKIFESLKNVKVEKDLALREKELEAKMFYQAKFDLAEVEVYSLGYRDTMR